MMNRQRLSTDEAIRREVRRFRSIEPISIARTVLAVRAGLPQCELTDRELGELVSAYVVAAGARSILFDMGAERRAVEAAVPLQ